MLPTFTLCMPALLPHFEPLPHQVDTAHKVLHEMRGRAILADEVGLGKTIEAGLILKEYLDSRSREARCLFSFPLRWYCNGFVS